MLLVVGIYLRIKKFSKLKIIEDEFGGEFETGLAAVKLDVINSRIYGMLDKKMVRKMTKNSRLKKRKIH